jgi:hypothetical protein
MNRRKDSKKLSISAIPHPAVCLHSDRPVSGLVSEPVKALLSYLPIPNSSTVVIQLNILTYRCGGSIGITCLLVN